MDQYGGDEPRMVGLRDAMKKGSENTKLRKKFPGGLMNLVSATKAGRLKSTTVRYVLLEEIDEYVLNVDGQGPDTYR